MRRIRDPELLDRLHGLDATPLSITAWRMARAGRDPLLATMPKGRWDDGSFSVLYTACKADCARAELHWHLTRSQPVYPSTLKLHLHELHVDAKRAVILSDLQVLEGVGVDLQRFGALDYAKLQEEYSLTQRIGEAAHFLGADALMVPSARWPGQNLVVLTGNLPESGLRHVRDHGAQDLRHWAVNHVKV
jgi:RES domain-containing protein